MGFPEMTKKSSQRKLNCKTLLLLFFLVLILACSSANGMKCRVDLGMSAARRKAADDCFELIKPNFKDHPKMNTSLEDFDFDDSCLADCFYKGIEMVTSDGAVIKDGPTHLYKEKELESSIEEKLNTIWNDCKEESEKIGKAKEFNRCKMIAMHSFCYKRKMFADKELLERPC